MLLAHGGSDAAWGEAAGVSTPRSARPQQCNAAAFRVVVDVGHSVQKPGARSARGVGEYDFNLHLAKLIEKELIDAGFSRTVLLVTADPPPLGLIKRVAKANS
ncbi:MAG TPA: N-acetylmuramoyl-L-alanine amidase, partial [Reyranella sp.]